MDQLTSTPLAAALSAARTVADSDNCRLYVVKNNVGLCDHAQRFLYLTARDLHNWSVPSRDVVGVVEPRAWGQRTRTARTA